MVKVNVRELIHHFRDYLEQIKKGERIVVLSRRMPVADIVPHNENIESPGWKRPIEKIQVEGASLAKATARYREEDQ
mgnify:CR=1 FL=1